MNNVRAGGLKPFRFTGSGRNMESNNKCAGEHEIYFAECIVAPSEGTVTVITICRHCDRVSFNTKQISTPHNLLVTTKDK